MNGRVVKKIRKLLVKPDAKLLLMIHNEFGEKTKNMDNHQVYKAVKKLYKKGLIKFKKERICET